jgi:L-alanine-DL-glutamate epimerase-like enolase superfamily enzyme
MTFSCHCPGIVGRLSLKEEERIAAVRKALDPKSLLLLDANDGPKPNREA